MSETRERIHFVERVTVSRLHDYLRSAKSPAPSVVLVVNEALLQEVANLLCAAQDEPNEDRILRFFQYWEHGKLMPAGGPRGARSGWMIDLTTVELNQPCSLVQIPPFFVVLISGLLPG